MALSKSNNPQLIELGNRFSVNHYEQALGGLARNSFPLPRDLVGSGDVAKVSAALGPVVTRVEGDPVAEPADPTYASVSLTRVSAGGAYDLTSELLDDSLGNESSALDSTMKMVANSIASWKDAQIRDLLDADVNVVSSVVADAASLSLGDVLTAAAVLPSRLDQMPAVYCSQAVYFHLKGQELLAGIYSGDQMVCGLPWQVVEAGGSASGDSLAYVGHM
ncbi:MAG: hypothetical protein ACR2NF_08840, partial [Pirellulales bacterium]